MRSEFSKWFERYENNNEYAAKLIAKDAYELGLQHQQSKVDELQAKLDQAYEDIETFATAHQRECEFKNQFAKEKYELQKRVDAALKLLVENSIDFYEAFESGKNSRIVDADELEQALKGGEK